MKHPWAREQCDYCGTLRQGGANSIGADYDSYDVAIAWYCACESDPPKPTRLADTPSSRPRRRCPNQHRQAWVLSSSALKGLLWCPECGAVHLDGGRLWLYPDGQERTSLCEARSRRAGAETINARRRALALARRA